MQPSARPVAVKPAGRMMVVSSSVMAAGPWSVTPSVSVERAHSTAGARVAVEAS